jgi:hypothetical protein
VYSLFKARLFETTIRYFTQYVAKPSSSSTSRYELFAFFRIDFYLITQSALFINIQAIQLKNVLYSKDESLKAEYQERWLRIADETRAYIKNKCIETLGTETQRPSQAAQCVGYIACVELPRNLWPECISTQIWFSSCKLAIAELGSDCLFVHLKIV